VYFNKSAAKFLTGALVDKVARILMTPGSKTHRKITLRQGEEGSIFQLA